MPIIASLAVTATSVNTGSEAGNEPPTETFSVVPLTEIVAVVSFTAVFAGAVETGAVFAGCAPLPADVPVPPPEVSVLPPDVQLPAPTPPAVLGAVPFAHGFSALQSEICWRKGSLLLKRLNE